MLQQKKPEDFVISTGRMETVRTFIELVAKNLGWAKSEASSGIIWEGEGIKEIGRREDTNEVVVKVDSRYFRPTEVDQLLGDSTKAKKKLGWEPKEDLESLVEEMVKNDLNEAKKELILKDKGFKISKSIENF